MTLDQPLIVYVDDEKPNRIVFEQSFAARFRVRTVASGAEALELLRQQVVAVLITDQRMPEMGGHELLTRVKEQYPAIIRVVITAYGDLDPILAAVNEGLVARYIVKPWDRAELDQILRWAVEAYEQSRESSALQLRLMRNERLATIGSVAASVLHDLNQPLGNLTLNADRLLEHATAARIIAQWVAATSARMTERDRELVAELSRELPEIAADLVASCKVMRAITGSMRQMLHPSKTPALLLATDPLPTLRFAMNVCAESVVVARARLTYDGPAALHKVRIGSTELSQVLINLISNAAQAVGRAGRTGGAIKVHAVEDATHVRFVIEDEGAGMSPEVMARAGTQFFSTTAEGTGLGVAQCRRLVGAAGGQLTIHSVEGKGTTVSFTISKS